MNCWRNGFGAVVVAVLSVVAVPAGPVRARPDPLPTTAELLARVPKHLSAQIPHDVDTALQKELTAAKKFAEVQLLFDIVSWESFVAVCWPVGPDHKPLPKLSDPGHPLFSTWRTDEEVFSRGAAGPLPWGDQRVSPLFAAQGVPPGQRVLRLTSAVGGDKNDPFEVGQAFSYPLWDQSGNMVRYEIVMNKDEFDYIAGNKLYTIAGQVDFSTKGNTVHFPAGDSTGAAVGAIELKLGWKILGKTDIPERFLVTEAYVLVGAGTKPVKTKLGLVAMHIGHKTVSSPQWIWSTFMHNDSLRTNALETHAGKPIPTLFNNPECETCPVNTPSATKAPYKDGEKPTQVLELVPVPKATQEVNRVVHVALAERHSVLRHYHLLNTQWPTDPAAKPTPGGPGTAPGSINNKSGGRPTPVYLTNPLMETYFQNGNQKAGGQEESGMDDQIVFGTESCMGCHSSAPVAIGFKTVNGKQAPVWGPQLSGDFSWLLRTKAQ